MPSVYDLKPKFQALLMPVMEFLRDRGVTPNMITFAALFLSFAMLFVMIQPHDGWFDSANIWRLLLMPCVLFIRMALNALDGMMARTYNMQSQRGEVLNELGDVLSDLALYLPFLSVIYTVHLDSQDSISGLVFWTFFLFTMILTEFCGVLGKAVVGVRFYHGPMGKSDRAFWIGLFCLLLVTDFLGLDTALFSVIFPTLSYSDLAERQSFRIQLFSLSLFGLSFGTVLNRLEAIFKTAKEQELAIETKK